MCNLELSLELALESLDNILLSDEECYSSIESYLDELVSHDSYDEVNAMFESVNEYDSVMEEDNGGNKKGIMEKIKKAIAWLKKKFFDIVSAIGKAIKKIFEKLKSLFKGKKKNRKDVKSQIQKAINEVENIQSNNNNQNIEDIKEKLNNKIETIDSDLSFYSEIYNKIKNTITSKELNIIFNFHAINFISSGIPIEIGKFDTFKDIENKISNFKEDLKIENFSPNNSSMFRVFSTKIENFYQQFSFQKISNDIKTVSNNTERGKKIILNKIKELDMLYQKIQQNGDHTKLSSIQEEISNTNKYMELYIKYQSEILNILNSSVNAYQKVLEAYDNALTIDIDIDFSELREAVNELDQTKKDVGNNIVDRHNMLHDAIQKMQKSVYEPLDDIETSNTSRKKEYSKTEKEFDEIEKLLDELANGF